MNKRHLLIVLVLLMVSMILGSVVVAQDQATEIPDPQTTEEAPPTDDMDDAGDDMDEMSDVDNPQTFVRFAHFAQGVDGVDVFLNDEIIEDTNLTYPGFTEWIPLETGGYNIDVAPTGGTVDDAVISAEEVDFGPGFVTVIVVPDANGNPGAYAVNVNYEELLPGTSGLMLVNGLAGETAVNFDRDDVPFVTELSSSTGRAVYTPVDTANYTFRAYDPFAEGEGNYGEPVEVDMVDGFFYVVAVVGSDGNYETVVHETTAAEYAMATGQLNEPGTLVEAVQSNDTLVGYADVLETAGLTDTLTGEGPYTVFLPADFLLDEINAQFGGDTEQLAATLRDHVIDGYMTLTELTEMDSITTLEGNTYDIIVEGNTVMIGDLQIIETNIPATNGVIHIINGVFNSDIGSENSG